MTAPIVPTSKAKALWATVIPLIASLVPFIAQLAGVIPAPWGPALTGILAVFAALTGTVVHQVPNKPTGVVVVSASDTSSPTSGWPQP